MKKDRRGRGGLTRNRGFTVRHKARRRRHLCGSHKDHSLCNSFGNSPCVCHEMKVSPPSLASAAPENIILNLIVKTYNNLHCEFLFSQQALKWFNYLH